MGALERVAAEQQQGGAGGALARVAGQAAPSAPAGGALARVAAMEGVTSGATSEAYPPVPRPAVPLIQRPELPPAVRDAMRVATDATAAVRFGAGLDTELRGNQDAKERALASTVTPIPEQGTLEALGTGISNIPGNFVKLVKGFGMIPAHAAQVGLEALGKLPARAVDPSGSAQAAPRVAVWSDPATGEPRRQEIAPDAPPSVFRMLDRVGASWEETPPAEPGVLEQLALTGPTPGEFAGEMARDIGRTASVVQRGEIAERGLWSVGIPGTDYGIAPRASLEKFAERPVEWGLDVSGMAALPGVAVRGAGNAAMRLGARLERMGATDAGPALARGGVAAQEFANTTLQNLHPTVAARALARKVTPEPILEQLDAGRIANDVAQRAKNRSIAVRMLAEKDIGDAMRPLEKADEATIARQQMAAEVLPPVNRSQLETSRLVAEREGRALPSAVAASDPAEIAYRDAAAKIAAHMDKLESEMKGAGYLQGPEAASREIAPLVQNITGKRIPDPSWTDVMVAEENARLAKVSPELGQYATVGEHAAAEARVRATMDAWNKAKLPDAPDWQARYFPRFPTSEKPSLRSILGEFYPSMSKRPAKQPIQKRYTGLSYLLEQDPANVREALVRHNAQVRRIIDSNRIIDDLLAAKKPDGTPLLREIKLDHMGRPLDANGNPAPLKKFHRAWSPEANLRLWRGQIDMGEEVLAELEAGGQVNQALLQGFKQALAAHGDDITKAITGVRKNDRFYEMPDSVARVVERQFGETHPWLRVADQAQDAWKQAVLAYSPRWYLNNMVGNLAMNLVAGGQPFRRIGADEAAVLPEVINAQGIGQDVRMRNTGGARTSPIGAAMEQIGRTAPIQTAGRTTQWLIDHGNDLVDRHFRADIYLRMGRQQARNDLVKRTGRAFFDSREILKEMADIKADPRRLNPLLESMDRVYPNLTRMSPVERAFFRRVFPFWAWYREIARITLALPRTSPVRAQLAQRVGAYFDTIDDREFEQEFGVSKKELDRSTEAFVGRDAEGRALMAGTRGPNPYLESWSIGTQSLNPMARFAAEEAMGGRQSVLGSSVPFRTKTETEAYEKGDNGELVPRKGPRAGWGLRAARAAFGPLMRNAEDLAQLDTEGVITRRYDDVTPFSNYARREAGQPVEPTEVFNYTRRKPAGKVAASDALLNFLGAGVRRLEVEEEAETRRKMKRQAATTLSRVPELQPRLREELAAPAGP